MEQKHNFNELIVDTRFPQAMYKKAKKGEGNLVSPGYPRILQNENGIPEKKYDRHPYTTALVKDEDELAAYQKQGWVSNPAEFLVE